MVKSRTAWRVVIATPYLAAANNGNWRTAARWARLLAQDYEVIVQASDAPLPRACDTLIALHARRSRTAVARWREEGRDGAVVVALTGTDLYRDISEHDPDAVASLAAADGLIVLQEHALTAVPARYRSKTRVVYQSARTLTPRPDRTRAGGRLACVLVAHLRPEKDPETVLAAWCALDRRAALRLTVVGEALDKALGAALKAAVAQDARIQWQGARSHAWTRQAIKRADLLICSSRMEGGANVVVEAVTAGTPVLASRMSGNLGMLGEDYAGYFPVGDAAALARLVARCAEDPSFTARLGRQCAARAPLFAPAAERAALRAAIDAAHAVRSQDAVAQGVLLSSPRKDTR
ncbi:MAG: selenoneine biosynthesis selenosugar synthase SenB [Casimicrobiaceae bacterium]